MPIIANQTESTTAMLNLFTFIDTLRFHLKA
jgi:hypothetical protein